MKIKSVAKGFTLIELLVVVLIIGILSAIALPMYRKAVEKSRVADALSTMDAVAKSEHGWYLMNNDYTNDFGNLDIELTDANGNKADNASFSNALYTYELLDTGIIADRNNGEYSLYRDYEMQQTLCSPGTHYICEELGAFTKEPCEKVDLYWANGTSTCYASDEARCKDLYDDNMWHPDQSNPENSYCGYKDRSGSLVKINEGMVCVGASQQNCMDVIVNSGGICKANAQSACNRATFNGGICEANGTSSCRYVTVNNGGICRANISNTCSGVEININYGGTCEGKANDSCRQIQVNDGGTCLGKGEWSCKFAVINSGGKCIAEGLNSCAATYNGTGATSGCCEGTYCPGAAPRCECPNHAKMDSNGNCITA